jgi:hypothetical protein
MEQYCLTNAQLVPVVGARAAAGVCERRVGRGEENRREELSEHVHTGEWMRFAHSMSKKGTVSPVGC